MRGAGAGLPIIRLDRYRCSADYPGVIWPLTGEFVTKHAHERDQLSVGSKLAYGFGQAAEGLKNGAFGVFLFFYYVQVLGLSGTFAGAAVGIALMFDALTDPLAGSMSDNWRSRLGRRHPFMYASALPLAITFFCLFSPPDLSEFALFLWLLTFAILPTLVLVKFVQGFGVVQALITFGSMVADIVDEHELATGKRQEGVFFASVSFSGKFTSGIGSVVGGVALDLISWPRGPDIRTAADVPPETLIWLGLIYGPIVAGFAVVSVWCYSKHNLDRRRHAEIVRELGERRRQQSQAAASAESTPAGEAAAGNA